MKNRIPCKCLLISSLSGLTSLAIPMHFLVVPDKFDIRRHKQGILYLSHIMRKPDFAICDQQRCRSACASAQADWHFCCLLPR